MSTLKIGIIGCGSAARIHARRLRGLPEVAIVACADPDGDAARALAGEVAGPDGASPALFDDHRRLLAEARPDALAIFTPPRVHYRPAMDALQAGCHVFIEKPLSTNAQEAHDIVTLARGRRRIVGVGHQYRLSPSLIEARRLLAEGSIGALRLVMATMAAPWLAEHGGPENAWRLDPRISGGGIVADAGDHLLDALLWATGRPVVEVAAFQDRVAPGLDVVDAAALRLGDGIPATLGVSGVSPSRHFELTFYGDRGALRASEDRLRVADGGADGGIEEAPLPEASESIDGNFVAAIRGQVPICCSAEQALETVRLQEAIARSATSGQVVRLAPVGPGPRGGSAAPDRTGGDA